jgi:hypothetical protein
MPSFPGERTFEHQVAHCFWDLVEEREACVMLQAMSCEAYRGPSSIQVCEPVEEFDSQPSFPYQLPGVAHHGSMEGYQVCRIG